MSRRPLSLMIAALALQLGSTAARAAEQPPSLEAMWALVQQQQAEIERLKHLVEQADTRIAETVVKVEATADLVEQGGGAPTLAAAARMDRNSFGGYGEMHYNTLDNERDGGKDTDQIDFHRFVLFFGHQFSERTRFYSELELEHAVSSADDAGEVEIEQAYIEHQLSATQRLKAGLFLLPVGILNETHEPDTFYGVERNPVENRIIPTTWWEGGLAFAGEIGGGFSYDAALTSGLGFDVDAGQWSVRDGRQKVSEADASDPAVTGRLKYTGVPGLEVAATLQYQRDLYQGEFTHAIDAWLYEAHLAYNRGPFGLRALYAGWAIDEGIEFFRAGADEQEGWYLEPSWRINPKLGVFARYSDWDNQAGAGLDTGYTQWNIGLNYWLEDNVVFKFDYQTQDAPDGRDQLDGINLGVGWSY